MSAGIKGITFLFVFLIGSSWVFSQNYYFQQYSLGEGLPQSQVLVIKQDTRGVIWVGTNGGGLCRFNGKKFQVYTRHEGLASNQVFSIFEDSKGNLWLGLNNGITVYDGILFKNIYFDSLNAQAYAEFNEDKRGNIFFTGLYGKNVKKIHVFNGKDFLTLNEKFDALKAPGIIINVLRLSDDRLLINTQNGIFEYKNETLTESFYNNLAEFKGKQIIARFEDKRGVTWFSEKGHPEYLYSYYNGQLKTVTLPDNLKIGVTVPIINDSKGNFWIADGSNGELYEFFGEINKDNYKIFTRENGLPGEIITAITEDNEGNLWFGTSGAGLIKYGGSKFISYTKQHGLGDNIVWSIFQDSKGAMWFGTNLNGLTRYDGHKFENFQHLLKAPLGIVRCIFENKTGEIIIGSETGLWTFNGKSFKNISADFGLPYEKTNISDVLIDKTEYWIGTRGNGLYHYAKNQVKHFSTEDKTLVNDIVNSVVADLKGNIWIGTNGGITLIRDCQSFNYSSDIGLSNRMIMQMTVDNAGNIWAATYGGGVCRITLNKNNLASVKLINSNINLSSDNVYSILTDEHGNIWAGCQNGVDKISLDKSGNVVSIRNYDKYEGFIGIENNGKANYKDRNGNLWFGTINGVMIYNPQVDLINNEPPVTSITKVKLFYKDVNWLLPENRKLTKGISPWNNLPAGLQLPFSKNHISFEFEGLSYKVPEKVRFQWKLDGVDPDWSPVTSQSEVIYSNLNPGYYVFHVKASNNDGVWNAKPSTYSFNILPPFWQTWWFRGITFTFIVSLTIIVFWLRSKMIHEKQEELQQLVAFKTRKLEEQKNEIQLQRDKLEQSYQNLDLLSKIGREITANLTVEAIVESVYDRLNSLMDASVFGLGIYDMEHSRIDFPILINSGVKIESISISLSDKKNFAANCLFNNTEIIINDYFAEYSDHVTEWQAPDNERDASSIIYLPLNHDNKPLGILTVQSYKENAFNEYHLNIIRNLAIYARIAFENARTYEKIQDQKNKLSLAKDDITRQKEEIEKKNTELQELNTEKSHIISIVAHDLRNPLTSALTMTGLLRSNESEPDEDIQQYVNTIEKSLGRMNEMIIRLLDIKKLEERIFDLRLERINLEKIIREVNRNLLPEIERKKIRIKIESEELYANVDRDYTAQIFENLLSNAIKFSPPEKNVYVRLTKENGIARTEIKDEGPGLTTEDMNKLFGKFQRLSARPTGGEHSTGLGLSIVKKYVEAMKGRVWCESEPGKGANFIVEFSRA
jgi:signal transduction histidine kinase/ligand-binding sensor domain-containing protein